MKTRLELSKTTVKKLGVRTGVKAGIGGPLGPGAPV